MDYRGEMITYDVLNAIAYQKLENKFIELGIKDAWKPGSKKADMINDALNKIKILKGLINTGLSEDEIADALNESMNQEKDLADKALLEQEEEKEKEVKQEEKRLRDMDLSIEVIEGNLERIEASLRNNIQSQRNVLLNKKNILIKMLENKLNENKG